MSTTLEGGTQSHSPATMLQGALSSSQRAMSVLDLQHRQLSDDPSWDQPILTPSSPTSSGEGRDLSCWDFRKMT